MNRKDVQRPIVVEMKTTIKQLRNLIKEALMSSENSYPSPEAVEKRFPGAFEAWQKFMEERGYTESTEFIVLGDGDEEYAGKLVAGPEEEPSWWVWDGTEWNEDPEIHELV